MKTAEEIYNQNGCDSKRDIIDAMKEFALEVAKEALKNASENAMMMTKHSDGYCASYVSEYLVKNETESTRITVNKSTITDESNIPSL